MKIRRLYPGGRPKALTLSYDDGIEQDRRFVEILNRHGLKCTFNLNSELLVRRDRWYCREVEVVRMDPETLPALYRGHEAALHMATHPHPTELSDADLRRETADDMAFHTRLFGYPVCGMAYPFGEYDERVIGLLEEMGVAYARTVHSTHDFSLPGRWLEWHPTVHHTEREAEPLFEAFMQTDSELALFYLWGHSYEFDVDQEWERIESLCARMADQPDIFYATNMEIYTYISALRRLEVADLKLHNPTEQTLWVEADGEVIRLGAGETCRLREG
ncbi:MAG: polysaccharide deacetylase family protein [Candidatus Howiella sp.]